VPPGKGMVTLTWTSTPSWPDSPADYTCLGAANPSSIDTFNATWWHAPLNSPDEVNPTSVGTKTILLTIGGSQALPAGWQAMATEGIPKWVDTLTALFVKTGMKGIDWDIEGTATAGAAFYPFLAGLSRALVKQKYIVSLTMSGNVEGTLAQVPDGFLDANADAFTIIPIMLYGLGMWGSPNERTWCEYVTLFQAKYPKLKDKILYALTLTSATGNNRSCCTPCIEKAISFVNGGYGIGVAIWCFNSTIRTGACGGVENVKVAGDVIKALKTGAPIVYTSCTGQLVSDPCVHAPGESKLIYGSSMLE